MVARGYERAKAGCWRRASQNWPGSSHRGSTILEQALVYPLLLGVVIAAVDVSRIFQGYSVLDEGMRSALRCVSPANGSCINSANPSTQSLYNIYENTTPIRYRLQQHRYLADASWIAQPIHQVNRIQAAVVSSLNYHRNQYQYSYQLERFRPQGQIGFAVETRSFPYITRDALPYLLPRIVKSSELNEEATPTVQISAPNLTVRHLSDSRRRGDYQPILNGSVKFTIPNSAVLIGKDVLQESEECFLQSNGATDFGQKCGSERHFASSVVNDHIANALRDMRIDKSTTRSETDQYAFVVIDIRGNVSSSANASGSVGLRISQPGGIDRELGGRRISGVGAMNFVPRGAPPSFYSHSLNSKNNYRAEVQNHQAILVKLGVEATLHFDIEVDDGNADLLEWRASQISIFTPQYETRIENASCDSLVSRERFTLDPKASCPKSLHPAGLPRSESLTIPGRAEQILQENLCLGGINPDGNLTLAARGIDEAENYRQITGPATQACGSELFSMNCPENKGVSGLALDSFDQGREVCGSEQAASVCPVPIGAELAKSCWRISAKDITPQVLPEWVKSICTKTSPLENELPAAVREYPEIILSSKRIPGQSEPLYTGGIAPAQFKHEHQELNCEEMGVEQRVIGEDLTVLKPESLFRTTSSLGSAFRDLLFVDAQHNFTNPEMNLNPAAFFEAQQELHSILVDSPPSDPKQIYWIEPAEPGQWQLIASHVPDSQTPAQCLNHPEKCRRELISLSTVAPSGPDFSAERAAAVGYQAVQAAMPALARQCSSSSTSCAHLVVEQEIDDSGKVFVARGEVRVPLILSPRPYTISRVTRSRWERDLVDK